MITSSKILFDAVDLDKILILIALNQESADYLAENLEKDFDIKISNVRQQKWYGIYSSQFSLKGPDIAKIVERWPPYKMMPDPNWGYGSFI